MPLVADGRRSNRLTLLMGGSCLLLAMAGVLLALVAAPASTRDGLAVDSIEDGVSLRRVDDRAVVIVRDAGRITVLDPRASTGDVVIWCPLEKRFVSTIYASVFTSSGRRIAGPAERDLREMPTRRDGPNLVVSLDQPAGEPVARWSDLLTSQWIDARGALCPRG